MMNLSASGPTAPVTIPQPPRGVTQTQHAVAAMTPRTREILPDALLDARVGTSTLAGALNDQIRFRVDRAPDLADWKLVPDSPGAQAILQSEAGASLTKQLTTAIRSIRDMDATTNLKGFMLPKDTEGVIAGAVLTTMEFPDDPDRAKLAALAEQGDTKQAGRVMRGFGDDLARNIASAGAWNSGGWITFLPDMARGMLVPGGGYRPGEGEQALRRATVLSNYLAGNAPHEVQHSVSPRTRSTGGKARWMEEGTANVFSRTPVFHEENSRRSGMNPSAYKGGLRRAPTFDPGWGPWTRPEDPTPDPKHADEPTANPARNYSRSQLVLRDLVRLAGVDFRSTAGQEQAFDLLQSESMRYTPGLLAKGIIEHQGLDPKVYDRLREQIKTAVDLPGGTKQLAEQFQMPDLPSRWEAAPIRA